ncbi:HNH endonuclease [Kribbella sp. WER1]|uniref:HNH endonuclease n=1 Tax=Kribbella sp. NPDC059898 TaxID=3346995 RepID=UPI003651AA92
MTGSAGRAGRRWLRLVAEVRARRGTCCRCGQRIDYRLAYPDPNSFSVDHFPYPLSTHPHLAEDPANLAPAHLHCNKAAGNRRPLPNLGNTSEQW